MIVALPATAASMSASSNMIKGALPPASMETLQMSERPSVAFVSYTTWLLRTS